MRVLKLFDANLLLDYWLSVNTSRIIIKLHLFLNLKLFSKFIIKIHPFKGCAYIFSILLYSTIIMRLRRQKAAIFPYSLNLCKLIMSDLLYYILNPSNECKVFIKNVTTSRPH